MQKGANRENPVLERNLRTNHTVEEVDAALAYHNRISARFGSLTDEMGEMTERSQEYTDDMVSEQEEDWGEEDEEEEGTADGFASDAQMHELQYANADGEGTDEPYPFQIEGNAPPGAGTVGEETVKEAPAST